MTDDDVVVVVGFYRDDAITSTSYGEDLSRREKVMGAAPTTGPKDRLGKGRMWREYVDFCRKCTNRETFAFQRACLRRRIARGI